MAEEREGGEVVNFISEQFRRLNLRLDNFEARFDERMDRLEERVAQVERRLTASSHLEQGIVAHLASLHDSMDNFRATSVSFDKRLATLETHR
ncbi:hypothetical protein Q4F19_00885 [Sphingomonas sp. BIUV-7]|uniref:Uncharacterized protein n=1 Tax=Sphingomonas natans TaxID=3063330 RepID=A0ABT8Y3P0_9SPHN|nr:hypothetical protein [Sphingomonas sp. BIUV-7]MDO6412927.1 hypothetical protein [Sphingomonas sp. BIUV-7]